MMEYPYIDLLIYLLLLSFTVRTVRNISYQTFLWQLKEYRIDRLLSHLSTDQGKRLLFGPVTLIKWILLALIILGIIYVDFGLIGLLSFSIFGFIWVAETAKYLGELIISGWKVPKLTIKTVVILVLALFFQFFPLINGNLTAQLSLGPFLDKLLAPTITILSLLLNFPIFLYKKLVIGRAYEKISKYKNLTVIGITGSYGKTSTKEFLATILSSKFKVAKTPEFTNTEIGIANYILDKLEPNTQVFVVEMGAYKKGEIKAICDMVRPRVGIVTGINEQHQELFRSLINTVKTKYELIESLPSDGIAIFNGNNNYCKQMLGWAENRRLRVFAFNINRDVKNIRAYRDHVEFIYKYVNENNRIRLNLLGKQNIENVLAAITCALKLGMTWEEIRQGIIQIISPPKTMQLAGKAEGMILVDDTFNTNPDGVFAAIDYMRAFKGKKLLVLTPLIELGEKAPEIHKILGEEAAKTCDLILLTNINFHKSFIDGAKKVRASEKIQIVNTQVGIRLIRENIDKEGVAVFEGKEAGRILEKYV